MKLKVIIVETLKEFVRWNFQTQNVLVCGTSSSRKRENEELCAAYSGCKIYGRVQKKKTRKIFWTSPKVWTVEKLPKIEKSERRENCVDF